MTTTLRISFEIEKSYNFFKIVHNLVAMDS